LLSIPIASYWSIKRLVLENLPSLKFEPLINLIGIIQTLKINLTIYPLHLKMQDSAGIRNAFRQGID